MTIPLYLDDDYLKESDQTPAIKLVHRFNKMWQSQQSYLVDNQDKALKLLIELHDLAARGDLYGFLLKFEALKQRHSNKSSFIGRLCNLNLGESTANA